ncbi:hypothetical protein Q757_06380 [Oenococcus alcoholitolerans]|uniref:Uncharacterized protein n=1 Tax=Oenococcus alcoholitolerans TaxID=931074 RepID=A0ABR4XRA2_9LACO|nr:hypothetical protein Q757_06380 [Oenococcus alcoholitolerans]
MILNWRFLGRALAIPRGRALIFWLRRSAGL